MYGGRTGLWGGALQIATSLLSLAVALSFYMSPDSYLMMNLVDLLSLGWKVALALVSSRRWPIWVAAFQLNVVGAHASIWLVPHWEGELYYAMFTAWGVPTLLAMIIGTTLDNRHERTKQARA